MATRKKTRHVARRGRDRLLDRRRTGTGVTTDVLRDRTGDARARRHAEKLIARVDALRDRITESFYKMGLALRELSRPETYGALGYATFAELLEDRDITSRPTATKLISVVDALEEEIALTLGIEKSYAFIRYAKTARPTSPVMRLAARNPVIPGTRTRLEDISVRDLREATKALDPRHHPPPARLRTTARKLGRALRAHDVEPKTVTVARSGREDVVRVELRREEAEALVGVLGR